MNAERKFTCIAARWFDKANGNTYHSCHIVRNSDGADLYCPMRYGYGDCYRQTALASMVQNGWITGYTDKTAYLYERDNNYPITWVVSDGLKRDCVNNGKE